MKKYFLLLFSASALQATAQKKPLVHTVYDSWQSIGERMISDDGKLVVYTITPQEGDATLVIQQTNGTKLLEIPRGYAAKISTDGRFVVCKVKPTYQQTRDAKIKKKKGDELPKDSLAIVEIDKLQVEKYPRVKGFKLAEESSVWLAYQYEKEEGKKADKADGDDKKEDATLLVLRNLVSGSKDSVRSVSEYLFDKKGNNLLVEIIGNKKDSTQSCALWMKLYNHSTDTLLTGFTDAKGYAFSEAGDKTAFVATTDTGKVEQKNYALYQHNFSSTQTVVNNNATGIPTKWRINENATLSFSKTGKRLFFGTSPALIPKDTSLPDFERVNVDVWHYNDDDLQPVQLKTLEADLKKSYLAVYDVDTKTIAQLGNEKLERIQQTLEGDGNTFFTTSDFGKRVARQWQGYTMNDVYKINPANGIAEMIGKDLKGNIYPSYTGKYLLMYDERKKQYSVYNASTNKTYAVAKDIPYALYDEENDVPDDPNAYGIVKWMEDDKYVLIYDRYDVWKVDPMGKEKSVALTNGRQSKNQYRFLSTNEDEKFLKENQKNFFKVFDDKSKQFSIEQIGLYRGKYWYSNIFNTLQSDKGSISTLQKAKASEQYFVIEESASQSPTIYTSAKADSSDNNDCNSDHPSYIVTFKNQLTNLNPQQAQYNWLTAELFKWKAYTGKQTEGILYKPENFDPKKKYPMIVYFYERNNNTLYNYQVPSPTPSRLNIPFFVSRGYIVFVPDIWYKTGKPAQSAYDYIVSGTRAVVKLGFVDSTKIGLQGQSWGGYQTAQLITMTKLYAAAWAGAPVANMFSAYGGIRWESGVNRQFQYEHTQSRIGATIWDRPDLYIENSPLFHLKKVTTPMVIMSNDKDGAVPWYQGIELFTAMRRLNKKVWMLNYNDEAHNLVERRNRKDIQIREQQFFDWLLKGEQPPEWITNGVPAIMKGRTWGL